MSQGSNHQHGGDVELGVFHFLAATFSQTLLVIEKLHVPINKGNKFSSVFTLL